MPSLISAFHDGGSASTIPDDECLRIAEKKVPDVALLLIRIKAREFNQPDPLSKKIEEFDALISLFNKLNFPTSSVPFTRQTPGVQFNRLLGEPINDQFPTAWGKVIQPYTHFCQLMFLAAALIYFIQEDTMNPYTPDSQVLRQIERRLTVKEASRIRTIQQLSGSWPYDS
jgi:hypothetical protein